MFQGQEVRRKAGGFALGAIVCFILGVVGSSYMHRPEPFDLEPQATNAIASPQLIEPGSDPSGGSGRATLLSGKVSINRGTPEELESLPGIGPVKAQAIIDYRLRIGGFKSLDEIMAVKGIGPKTYQKLLPRITL